MSSLGGLAVQEVSETVDWGNYLIYGDPGVGKTRLAGSASHVPAMSPVLVIDIEGGSKTIRSLFPDVKIVRPRDEFDDQGRLKKTAWEKLQDVYEAIRKGVDYKTIVIDNLTEAQKLSMASILTRDQSRQRADPDIPAMQDWGKSGEQVRRFVRAFRDLECHVIFTAWAQRLQDQKTGQVQVKPSLPGKLADEIAGFLDEVLFLYTKIERKGEEGIQRYMLSQPTDKHTAKDRSGRLPTTMENPSMEQVAALVLD